MQRPGAIDNLSASQAAHGRGIEWLGRLGLFAQGVSYGIVGWLAVRLALGHGGAATSRQGALKTLADDFGPVLLGITGAGLLAFGLFCVAQARYRQV